MAEKDEPIFDWLNLPSGIEPIDLWDALHDGDLRNLTSNLLERTLAFEVDSLHIRSHHELGEDFRFKVTFVGVQSVRASSWSIWPGEPPDSKSEDFDVQEQMIAEYQAKWREESVTWQDFEAAVNSSTDPIEILEAEMATNNHQVAWSLYGRVDNSKYFDVFIRAEGVIVEDNSGKQMELSRWIKLGEQYWEAFGSGRG